MADYTPIITNLQQQLNNIQQSISSSQPKHLEDRLKQILQKMLAPIYASIRHIKKAVALSHNHKKSHQLALPDPPHLGQLPPTESSTTLALTAPDTIPSPSKRLDAVTKAPPPDRPVFPNIVFPPEPDPPFIGLKPEPTSIPLPNSNSAPNSVPKPTQIPKIINKTSLTAQGNISALTTAEWTTELNTIFGQKPIITSKTDSSMSITILHTSLFQTPPLFTLIKHKKFKKQINNNCTINFRLV